MNRLEMLQQVLNENPNDAFARYGLAMEYAKTDLEKAMGEFHHLLELHPDYTPGYFMAAQTLASAGRTDDAKQMLNGGIASAARAGNAHAKAEMEAMLAELG